MLLKKKIKNFILSIISIGPVAVILNHPLRISEIILRRVHGMVAKLSRNLHRLNSLRSRDSRLEGALKYYKEQKEFIKELPYQPLMSILIPVYKVKKEFFFETLQSISAQTYSNWEVCLVDDHSQDPALLAIIKAFQKAYPQQTKFKIHERNQHISITSNTCLSLATGDYVVIVDHDDRLYPNALGEAVRYINLHGEPDILYSDECNIDAHGNRNRPVYHKPDWSPLMHLASNYTTHLSIYRRSLMEKIGGFRAGFEGSQDHDLMFRACEATQKPIVHIPFNLYQWRAHENSTAMSQEYKPYAAEAGVRAVQEALVRRNRPGSVSFNPVTLQYRIKYEIIKNPDGSLPLVSIIIPSKDAPGLIKRCLDSVFQKSTYPLFEVIISDNGTTHPQTLNLYEEFKTRYPNRFRIIQEKKPFNFGYQINLAAQKAQGAYYLLLNNDTEVISPEWIEEMLSLAQFKETGAVGAKLFFSNGSIQHAGIFLSSEFIAEHIGITRDPADDEYWNYHNIVHEVSAVTAACLLISRDKYWQVKGLDATYLPRAFGDVEFCIALRDLGYSNIFTPFATLYHHESFSRGKSIEYFERFYLLTRRGRYLSADPFLNLNYHRHARFELNDFYEDLDLDKNEFAWALRELAHPQFKLPV
jgi:glycosyltransferase involved in cell wall biosynthesis